MAHLSQNSLNAVVPIFENADNETEPIGTGFFVVWKTDNSKYAHFLVTNRHVIEHLSEFFVEINQKDKSKPPVKCNFPLEINGESTVHYHRDSSIDIALIGFNYQVIKENNLDCKYMSNEMFAPIEKMKVEGIFEGDSIYLIGFPIGLVDTNRIFRIVKSGIIARIQGCLSGESNYFIIDSMAVPGNSGGPVLLKPEGSCIDGTTPNLRSYLIGIQFAHLYYEDLSYDDEGKQLKTMITKHAGLSVVYPVDFIIDIINERIAKHRLDLSDIRQI